jgi:hypothetical protein
MPRFTPKSLLATAVLLSASAFALGNLGGPTSGNSGDPVFNRTCRNCHGGSPLNQAPVKLEIVAGGTTFVPGSVLPVTVRFQGTLQSPRNGFQASAWKGKPSSFGDLLSGWALPFPATTRSISGHHVTHDKSGSLQSAWTVYFATPVTSTAFTVFAAGNDTDNNGKNTGDRVYTAKLAMQPGAVPLSMAALPQTGATVPLDLDAPGLGGRSYALGASLGDRGLSLGGRAVPLAVDALLFVSVGGLAPGVFRDYVGILDKQGRARAQLVIPSAAALAGVTVHHAFVVLDASKPGGVGLVSNPLPVTVY